jgi:AcrR family transcriptional regulator
MTSRRVTATKNRILDGAIAEFAQFGQDATVEQILQAVGVGRTTFYRHFKSLEDVLSQAVVRDLDALLINVGKEQSRYDTIENKIIEGMMYCLREFSRHPLSKLIYAQETALILSRIGTYEEHFNSLGARYIAPVYDFALEQGRVREGVDLPLYVEWMTRVFVSLLTVQSPMMKDGIKMRQFLNSFLVPSLIEPVQQTEISEKWAGMQ